MKKSPLKRIRGRERRKRQHPFACRPCPFLADGAVRKGYGKAYILSVSNQTLESLHIFRILSLGKENHILVQRSELVGQFPIVASRLCLSSSTTGAVKKHTIFMFFQARLALHQNFGVNHPAPAASVRGHSRQDAQLLISPFVQFMQHHNDLVGTISLKPFPIR